MMTSLGNDLIKNRQIATQPKKHQSSRSTSLASPNTTLGRGPAPNQPHDHQQPETAFGRPLEYAQTRLRP